MELQETFIIKRVLNEKGIKVWPFKVDKLILSLLATGIKPSAISNNIAFQATSVLSGRNIQVKELPSEVYIYRCRGKIRLVILMYAAYQLAKTPI